MAWSDIVSCEIVPAAVLDRVGGSGHGAVNLFLGVVRDCNEGKSVSGMEYEAYEAMAREQLAAIASEAEASLEGGGCVAAVHRLGDLKVGETSVAVAVSAPHRASAFEAARGVMDQIKARLPIWKRERYVDGSPEWLGGRTPAAGADATLVDGFGRRIEYLRISVTDKCNLRCVYCMPEEGLHWLRRDELLSYEEIARVVETMAGMGLRRLRLTGGEPLVRKDLDRLASLLRAVDGIEDIALSTNAVLLAPVARRLRDAGISRINISLDSLRPERADEIARRPGTLARVMEGLDAALDAGFDPVKINVVLVRGVNDDEVPAFAELTRTRPVHVRFIEIMPTASNLDLSADNFLSCDEALAAVSSVGELRPAPGPPGNGPATYFALPGALGTIGAITPMSHNFCDRCNRMRLTADGQLRPCLFGDIQTPLRDALRRGEDLRPLVEEALRTKPERHLLVQGSAVGSGGLVALSQTGG